MAGNNSVSFLRNNLAICYNFFLISIICLSKNLTFRNFLKSPKENEVIYIKMLRAVSYFIVLYYRSGKTHTIGKQEGYGDMTYGIVSQCFNKAIENCNFKNRVVLCV